MNERRRHARPNGEGPESEQVQWMIQGPCLARHARAAERTQERTGVPKRLRDQSLRALFVGMVLCVLATLLLEGGGCDVSESQLFNLLQSVSVLMMCVFGALRSSLEQLFAKGCEVK